MSEKFGNLNVEKRWKKEKKTVKVDRNLGKVVQSWRSKIGKIRNATQKRKITKNNVSKSSNLISYYCQFSILEY